jgi:hypothetical protein
VVSPPPRSVIQLSRSSAREELSLVPKYRYSAVRAS